MKTRFVRVEGNRDASLGHKLRLLMDGVQKRRRFEPRLEVRHERVAGCLAMSVQGAAVVRGVPENAQASPRNASREIREIRIIISLALRHRQCGM